MPATEPILSIHSRALRENWQTLNARTRGKAGAVVKANGYGLGVKTVAPILAKAGAKEFFVASLDEAIELKSILREATIFELSGLSIFAQPIENIIPVINSDAQFSALDSREFALQFDTGMTRLGLAASRATSLSHLTPTLVMSHLACADDPNDEMNQAQLTRFQKICANFENSQKSLAATGGILLGEQYHFDLARPGIGIYGGEPFIDAMPSIQISLPVLQIYQIEPGVKIGYGGTFIASTPMRVATLLGGYADGISRALSNRANLFADGIPCPILGRISMDAITVDITHLDAVPERFDLLDESQNINDLAKFAQTIPYELLTSIGTRYKRTVL